MASKMTIKLPNGHTMPALGFGTWQASDEELDAALDEALEAGYRHIDTAPVYENDTVIGNVLKRWLDSGRITREELFIVTKLPPTGNRPEGVEKWIKRSLDALQLEYLDLYLIHTPFSFEEYGEDLHPVNENGEIRVDPSTDHIATWAEMEKQVAAGRTRAIGVSNFNIKQMTRLLSHAKLPISNFQFEVHVYFQQKELIEFCRLKGIPITAYSPLGSRGFVQKMNKTEQLPNLLENPTVIAIAKKHNKKPAQIVLRFLLQNNIAAIPKSTNPQRIMENIDLFDWELDGDDMTKLAALDQGPSARICDFLMFKGIQKHPEYPF